MKKSDNIHKKIGYSVADDLVPLYDHLITAGQRVFPQKLPPHIKRTLTTTIYLPPPPS